MKYLLIFLTFSLYSQDRLVYTNYYRSPTIEKSVSLVLVFRKDSVRVYIHEIGYIWMKIEAKDNVINSIKDNLLERGNYFLSYNQHSSYMIVTKEKVIHTILLRGDPPIVILTEMIRNFKLEKL